MKMTWAYWAMIAALTSLSAFMPPFPAADLALASANSFVLVSVIEAKAERRSTPPAAPSVTAAWRSPLLWEELHWLKICKLFEIVGLKITSKVIFEHNRNITIEK